MSTAPNCSSSAPRRMHAKPPKFFAPSPSVRERSARWWGLVVIAFSTACAANADPVSEHAGLPGFGGTGGSSVPSTGGSSTGGTSNGGRSGSGGSSGLGSGFGGTSGTGGAGGALGSGPQGTGGGAGFGGTGGSSGSAGQATGGTGGACFPFPCPSGGAAGAAGTAGTAGTSADAGADSLPGFTPAADNPKECPAGAPANPVGSCLGLPIYVRCVYTNGARTYTCVCDWYHWLCA